MILYRFLSVAFFILRYRLIPRCKTAEIGIGGLRQLYLNYGRPFFKSSEEDLIRPFKRILNHATDSEGDVVFYIALDNRIPLESNSKESVEVLKDYDLLPPL